METMGMKKSGAVPGPFLRWGAVLCLLAVAASPDWEGLSFFKGTRFSGFLDAYYGFNFDEPADRKVLYRNFDFNHNSLTLSQVSVDISKPVS